MPRPRTSNVQINIAFLVNGKKNWKTLPESIRLKKVKRSLFLDLMRRGIQEKYQLKDVNDHEE